MSLLGNIDDLVGNEDTLEVLFKDECKKLFPDESENFINKYFVWKNNSIYIRTHILIRNNNNIFKGFASNSNISHIPTINAPCKHHIIHFYPNENVQPISRLIKYPIHIEKINLLKIENLELFDYSDKLQIDYIDSLNLVNTDDESNIYNFGGFDFDFFKCIKQINVVRLYSRNMDLNGYTMGELKPGIIRNINANGLCLDAGQIDNKIRCVKDLKNINYDKLKAFMDGIYKYNNIQYVYISSAIDIVSDRSCISVVNKLTNGRYELRR